MGALVEVEIHDLRDKVIDSDMYSDREVGEEAEVLRLAASQAHQRRYCIKDRTPLPFAVEEA